MKKLSILILTPFLFLPSFICASSCPLQYQIPHPYLPDGMCLQSTQNPIFADCKPSLSFEAVLSYCGYMPDGKFLNFSHPCQAYRARAKGFYFGSCSCSKIICPSDTVCRNGNCEKRDPCDGKACGIYHYCKEGECVSKEISIVGGECKSSENCGVNANCIEGKCQYDSCRFKNCGETEVCVNGFCQKKYDYYCSKYH